MAKAKAKTVKETVKETAVAASLYSVDELVAAFKLFGATPDIVRTALVLDGKETYSREEAEAVVAKFGGKIIK